MLDRQLPLSTRRSWPRVRCRRCSMWLSHAVEVGEDGQGGPLKVHCVHGKLARQDETGHANLCQVGPGTILTALAAVYSTGVGAEEVIDIGTACDVYLLLAQSAHQPVTHGLRCARHRYRPRGHKPQRQCMLRRTPVREQSPSVNQQRRGRRRHGHSLAARDDE